MKLLVALLIVVAAAKAGAVSLVPGLRVRFGIGDEGIGTSFFFDIARNETQAIANGMIEMTPPERKKGPLSKLKMFCFNGFYLCELFDDTGYIAGLQISFPKDDMNDSLFNYTVQGFTTWKVELNNVSTEFWTTQMYFISTETLEKSKECRIAARNPCTTLQDGGVWVTGYYGELYFISDSACEIANNSSFTLQGCFAGMGLHYFYEMYTDTECTSDSIFPWFAIVESGELIAVGFVTSGNLTLRSGATNYFESPTSTALEAIIPNGPQCVYDLADSPGFTSMHTYFIDEPWTITCPSSD